MRLQRPPILPTVFMLICVMILLFLAGWQWQRLHWKQQWLTEIDASYRDNPAGENLSASDFKVANEAGKVFLHGNISGDFLFSKEIYVGIRTHEGTPGYHVLTPFLMNGGGVIFVNRGWTALAHKGDIISAAVTSVSGFARLPQDSFMAPANEPDKDVWYRSDIDHIAAAKGLEDVLPYIFYAEQPTGSNKIAPHASGWRPNNNHFSYMLFWLSMAAVLMIVYFLRFIRKPA